jgi:tripartite-type tricarboxylate transporter receptor subunit TctC
MQVANKRSAAGIMAGMMAVALGGFQATALAQSAANFPTKPVRFILAFGAAGGAPDVTARLIGPKLTEAWGQQIIIDGRSGAGGILGTEAAARATPDGYTYLITSPAHAINPALHDKLPYDPVADFIPLSVLTEVPNIVIVHPSVPARTVKELIAHARANAGKLNYGSAGTGSSQHLAGELFSKMAGVKMVHVPYKSGPAAVVDLVAGQVQLTFGSSSALPMVRAGKLIALAVTTSQRVSSLPDLPTVSEAALPGYSASAWYIMLAPARTPRPLLEKVQAETVRALKMPDVKEKLSVASIEVVGSSPAEAEAFLKKEIDKWATVVKESGAKAN